MNEPAYLHIDEIEDRKGIEANLDEAIANADADLEKARTARFASWMSNEQLKLRRKMDGRKDRARFYGRHTGTGFGGVTKDTRYAKSSNQRAA